MSLNAKQARFVQEYLKDLNATQAAIRAGYSEKTAMSQGSRLLSNAKVAEAITKGQVRLADKLEISVERVLQEYARLAFLDISKAFTDDGRLKPLHEMDEDTRRALAGIEVEEIYEWTGSGDEREREHIGTLRKVKFTDKVRALDSLSKHLGMFVERVDLADRTINMILQIADKK